MHVIVSFPLPLWISSPRTASSTGRGFPFTVTASLPVGATETTILSDLELAVSVAIPRLFIGRGVLRGVGDSRTPLRVTALANLVNIVLAYGLICGTGNTRFPLLVTGTSIWAATGLAFALIETIGGGLTTIWAAFLVLAPVMAFLMWRRFQRTVAAF